MPIPFLVPVVLGAITAAGTAKGGYDMYQANEKRKDASSRKQRAEALAKRTEQKTLAAKRALEEDCARFIVVQAGVPRSFVGHPP